MVSSFGKRFPGMGKREYLTSSEDKIPNGDLNYSIFNFTSNPIYLYILKVLVISVGMVAVLGYIMALSNDLNKKARAKEAVRIQLVDPYSVRFKRLYVVNKEYGEYVRGYYNAKNGFGGYVGYKEFCVFVGDGKSVVTQTYLCH